MILVNKIRCRKCGDVIESKSVHDFKWCKCGACAVDGGHDYLRRGGNREDWEELSEQNDEERVPRITKNVMHEPRHVIDLYSEKYDISGQIDVFGDFKRLTFKYNGIKHIIGMWDINFEELEEKGLKAMEDKIGYLKENPKDIFLHYWHIDREDDHLIAHGVVTGHPRLEDATKMHTSYIGSTVLDMEREELVIYTMNTVYHCHLNYCNFEKQDEHPELIENYEEIKEKYKDKIDFPEIEKGKILLVLSDFDEYYFHSLCAKDENGKPKNYMSYPHVGTFQDSFLIHTDDDSVDIRYFPYYKRIEFYAPLFSEKETHPPMYAENIGSSTLFIQDGDVEYRLDPGERKELKKENAEQDPAGT